MQRQSNSIEALSLKFPGKRVFITGAAAGLGSAFATDFAASAWTIGITDLDEQNLAAAASVLESLGARVEAYNFDVSDYAKFSEAVNDFARKYGGIDIGINNAGIGCGGNMHEVPIETFRRVVEVNLMGVANGCHLFVPLMKQQGAGHILNIASAAAFVAAPRMTAYNCSKAAVLSLSETLRAELLDDGISVTVLLPTYIRTNIAVNALGTAEGKDLAGKLVEHSTLTADRVARETLAKMVSGDLYVVLPNDARFLWRYKRIFPDRFYRFIHNEVKRRIDKLK